jgi:phosphatidylglycerophosphate synthase
MLAVAVWALSRVWSLAAALQWGLQASMVLAYVLIRLGGALELNFDPRGLPLRPRLSAATGLTLTRSALVAALAGFLFQPRALSGHPAWLSWIPGCLYITAVVLDYFDGYLARRTGTEARLGEFLDTEVDAAGLMVASLFLVWSGMAPLAYLTVGIGYYALKLLIRIRRQRGRFAQTVKPRPGARLVAGLEMGVAGLALLPVFGRAAIHLAAWVMTAALLEELVRDWWVVCGRASNDGRPLGRRMEAFERVVTHVLPLAVRAVILASAGRLLAGVFLGPGLPELSSFQSALLLVFAVLCVLGVAARAAAVVLSLIGAGLLTGAPQPTDAALLMSGALILIMTGAGPWRLWQPEDRLLLEKRGASKATR